MWFCKYIWHVGLGCEKFAATKQRIETGILPATTHQSQSLNLYAKEVILPDIWAETDINAKILKDFPILFQKQVQ